MEFILLFSIASTYLMNDPRTQTHTHTHTHTYIYIYIYIYFHLKLKRVPALKYNCYFVLIHKLQA